MRLIEKVWFQNHRAKWLLVPLLLPLTVVFWLLTTLRLWFYKLGIKSSIKVACPVVIVGNIGVGGNGKTPVVIHLVEQLKQRGIKAGVLSRGYGGNAPSYPYQVTSISTAKEAGDEPLLIFQRCHIPVVVGADRIAAANKLLELGCQIIISDDGLQHYRLARDYELLVIDGKRLFGNGWLLPAGPLRESTARLNSVNRIVLNGKALNGKALNAEIINSETQAEIITSNPIHSMVLSGTKVVNLKTNEQVELSDFIEQNRSVTAIAGIGDPNRFFDYLTQLGFELDKVQEFIDHQTYNNELFKEVDDQLKPLLMTEKDAVKCKSFAENNWWYLPVDAQFSPQDNEQFMAEIIQLVEHEQLNTNN